MFSLRRVALQPAVSLASARVLATVQTSSSLSRSFFASLSSEKLFDKILIANRGEIAIRIMKTCKKLGIKTVAVYSEADVNALHVRHADEAVCIGPAPSAQSYLDADAVLRACKLTGAQAVHPGYGFLSEKSTFSNMLESNGIVFIGPKVKSMEAMGDKIESKKIAAAAKVNTIPGYDGVVRTNEEVLKIANQIGYPVMIKASAGGGGKGMRIARNDKEALQGFELSTQEAKSSFADDRVFIEKFIEQPRHIEFQLLADGHGNAVYLNERECTIQRRNQKVIEEAPSTFLTPELRQQMGAQAVALAKAVGYQSAGTVEFLVDKHRKFYFLEMNTRLQVEHPITEAITGLDLVHEMIRVAAGHKLNVQQSDVGINGWALESRVYAEDPLRGFLPSIGRLRKYQEPIASETVPGTVRCDAGVTEGSEITRHYDPMICKLVTHGKNRDEAIAAMRAALDSYVIRGVTHNVNFLRSLLENKKFLSGDMSTAFIPEEFPNGYKGQELNATQSKALINTAVVLHCAALLNRRSVSSTENMQLPESVNVRVGDASTVKVHLSELEQDGSFYSGVLSSVGADGQSATSQVSFNWSKSEPLLEATVDGETHTMQLLQSTHNTYSLQHVGTKFDVRVLSDLEQELIQHMPVKQAKDQTRVLVSPMPGAVFALKVNVGDAVVEGQEVCVVEAMKMQNALLSPRTGKVKKIYVSKGSTVQADDTLIEFE